MWLLVTPAGIGIRQGREFRRAPSPDLVCFRREQARRGNEMREREWWCRAGVEPAHPKAA